MSVQWLERCVGDNRAAISSRKLLLVVWVSLSLNALRMPVLLGAAQCLVEGTDVQKSLSLFGCVLILFCGFLCRPPLQADV